MRCMPVNQFINKEKMKWKETKFKDILPLMAKLDVDGGFECTG